MSEQTPQFSPSDLCRSCGLCCDGTLFGKVQLLPEDDPEPLRLTGIVVTSDDTGSRFKLACAAHQQGCCQVYASRPSNCRGDKCRLLMRFKKGDLTWTEAGVRIGRLRRLREQLGLEVERLRPGMGRASVAEIKEIVPPIEELKSDVELHRRWAPALLRLVALRRFALEEFHAPRQPGAPGVAPDESPF
jgi:hypothetical protein